jgi:hypothetical protein
MKSPQYRSWYLLFVLLIVVSILLSACEWSATPPADQGQASLSFSDPIQTEPPAKQPDSIQDPPATKAPAASTSQPQQVGPDSFPAGYNPLTGQPVSDPSLLDLPAVLVSITNFPPSARPQSGLSYAPWVFELYIAEGMTRFLATFYGDFPQREPELKGSCTVRSEPFEQTSTLLGNRVWLDKNGNGLQDPDEPGLGGVCVNLYDAATGNLLADTSTDLNGYYSFNVSQGGAYVLEFVKPDGLQFTSANIGDDQRDSDADPASGRTAAFTVAQDDGSWDAGFLAPAGLTLAEASGNPAGAADVGPVRSGRLPYVYIRDAFQNSCLIYASATEQIRAQLRGCAMVFGNDGGNINSAMLDVTRLEKIAEENKRPSDNFNYSGNLFSEQPLAQGAPADEIQVYYSFLNQSQWKYDAASGKYLRYEDLADGSGNFRPALDRLNGQQLAYSNVIVLYAAHTVINPYIIDIRLGAGEKGKAVVFRDGQKYDVTWTTVSGEYEKSTGLRRPIRFLDANGNPFALKPGQSWVHLVTPATTVSELTPGIWKLRFYAPAGAK